jgi:hypothetical protein
MHYQSQLADLVDVLTVDFDIVDRLGDSRKGYAQNQAGGFRREARGKTQSERLSIATKPLALGLLS